jgi:hypothetical protein
MPLLTIENIQSLAEQGKLARHYTIKTPLSISSNDLIWTLTLFKENDQMIDFISQISENTGVTIQVNNKKIQQGSADRFVHVYAEHGTFIEELPDIKQQRIISFLKSHLFKGAHLNYLLQNLSSESIAQFVLATKCFEQSDLLSLCNDPDALYKFPEQTIKLLYDFFNKERRWDESITPVFDMYYFANRTGHVLGLSNPIVLSILGNQYQLETNWNYSHASMMVLCEAMTSYAQRFPSVITNTILAALKKNLSLFKENNSDYKNDAYIELLRQYRRRELTFISCGWPGHTVAVVLYGDYLIYTNRGIGGDKNYGSKIFKIKNRKYINDEFMSQLLSALNANEFHSILGQVIDFKNPVLRMHSKPQKYDTCTLANPKSSIEPMQILVEAGYNATQEEIKRVAFKERSRFTYKHCTNFIRNREMNEIVKSMFYANTNYLISFYAKLVSEIIFTHHGQRNKTVKDRQEKTRALNLFERTPEKIQRVLRKNSQLMEIIDDLKLMQPLPNQALFWMQRHELIRNNKSFRTHQVTIEGKYIVEIDKVKTPKTPYSFGNVRKLCRSVIKNW